MKIEREFNAEGRVEISTNELDLLFECLGQKRKRMVPIWRRSHERTVGIADLKGPVRVWRREIAS